MHSENPEEKLQVGYLLLNGHLFDQRMFRTAGSASVGKNSEQVMLIGIPSVWKLLHPYHCLPKVCDASVQKSLRDRSFW